MLPTARNEQILAYIRKKGSCSIAELATHFKVSRVTVHRILNNFDASRLVTKVHGGVISGDSFRAERGFDIRMRANSTQKKEIARKVLSYIERGKSLFLDSSTTCFYLAKELSLNKEINLTIVTNSPQVVTELSPSPNFCIISTGGELQYQMNALAGPIALEAMSRLQFDKAFISAGGVSLTKGIMTTQYFIVELGRKILEVAKETILLVDASKFDKIDPLEIAPISKPNMIVSDSRLPKKTLEEYKAAGVEVIV